MSKHRYSKGGSSFTDESIIPATYAASDRNEDPTDLLGGLTEEYWLIHMIDRCSLSGVVHTVIVNGVEIEMDDYDFLTALLLDI